MKEVFVYLLLHNGQIKFQREKTIDTPIISPDVYPTILGLTEVTGDSIQNKEIDGVNFSNAILNEIPVERTSIYWHYPHYHLEGAKPYSAIRKGDWKLIEVFEKDTLELYNLNEDIGETKT